MFGGEGCPHVNSDASPRAPPTPSQFKLVPRKTTAVPASRYYACRVCSRFRWSEHVFRSLPPSPTLSAVVCQLMLLFSF